MKKITTSKGITLWVNGHFVLAEADGLDRGAIGHLESLEPGLPLAFVADERKALGPEVLRAIATLIDGSTE